MNNANPKLDPPILTSTNAMDAKKMAPPPQQRPPPLQPPPLASPGEQHYPQPARYPLGPPRPHRAQPLSPRSPLLENHQDLYGTRQPTELSRQYAIREQSMQLAAQRAELQQRSIPMVNSSYSLQSPSDDPILSAPVPPGYNASVHQAYLRRNQHQLTDHQIYQNHQSLYQPTTQQPRIYQPYTSRIQTANYLSPGHSHPQLLRQQYNELQQMKLQQQMQYQSQAQIQQQQTFAQRQILHQHLHSRQQSQQNLSQYGTSPSTAQLNEVNVRLSKKQDNNQIHDDYSLHPPSNGKGSHNQNKLNAQSPSVHIGNSPVSKTSGDPASSPSTKSPSGSESRRSSSGTTQALRSPIAQRPLSAPVTKAGWLYKQGSDGLKVWRKRWFVLSEYCLFYYKGQEEDKLLGSVLLPSYRVSPCSLDDKVLKKYAFKCEHANMRTYVLAASDQRDMEQWVNVLTMAALMQEGVSTNEKTQNFTPKSSAHNSERRSKPPVNYAEQDDISPEMAGGIQPTYENAPPKPRRSNEGYNSPSPERSMERYDPNYDILRDPSAYNGPENGQQKQVKNRMNAKSPLPGSSEPLYQSKSGQSHYASQRHLTKSPEAIYNAHNLSLPLTNTNTNRLENNKSPMNYQENMANRTVHNNNDNNRLMHNKSPAYFESRNASQQEGPSRQNYQIDNQNLYGETSYQKMLQHQEMNKQMAEQYSQEQLAMQSYQQNVNSSSNIGNSADRQSFERRTPDTYGRSAIVPGYYSKGRSSDYEDVYNNPQHSEGQSYAEQAYRRPMSPMAYEEKKLAAMQLQHQRYTSANQDNNQIYQAPPVQMRQKKLPHNYSAPVMPHNTVPRPHSADFLEYESKNSPYDPNIPTRHTNQPTRQPPRPKSSLDINTYNDYNGGDSYYYSEASYAEKMRQSAHYLRNKSIASTPLNSRASKLDEYTNQRKLSMPTFRVNDGNVDSSNYDSDIRIDGEAIYGIRDQNRNVSEVGKYPHSSDITGPNSNWTLRNKSLSHIMSQDDVYNRSNSAMSEGSTVSGFNRDQVMVGSGSTDQFIRSASARLPSTSSEQLCSKDGERKVQQREESMKRLLEWKQRMLQSPLTRKTTPTTLSMARSLHQTKAPGQPYPIGGQTFPKSTRLPSHQQQSYTSYSSDDEELSADADCGPDSAASRGQGQGHGHGHGHGHSQAGSSSPPSPLLAHPPTLVAHAGDAHSPTPRLPSLTTPADDQSDSDTESDMRLEYTDNDLDEILAQSEEEEESPNGRKSVMKVVAPVEENVDSSKKETDSMRRRFPDYEICEINQNASVLDENETIIQNVKVRSKAATPKPETPPNPDICEDHYLPMSPRKASSLEPAHTEIIKNISVFGSVHRHEDNPYVEMSQGIGVESAFLNEEMQAYEIVCVNSGKVEPVYMELNHLSEKNILDDKSSSTAQLDANESSIKEAKVIETKEIPPPKSILRKQSSDSKLSVKSLSRPDVKSPLPDILIASQGKANAAKSDSSDADDEASKDFSLDTAYSRFSLSDNFRPASYYLGSSGILAELQDSSDCELISPPPIPTSPPPVEELDVSLDSRNSSQHLKPEEDGSSVAEKPNKLMSVERKSTSLMIYGNTPSMYDTIFKGERVKRNRASLPDNDHVFRLAKQSDGVKRASLDSKSIPPSYKTSGNTDTDSLLSYNADRGSSRMSMESDISSKFDVSTPGGSFSLASRPNFNIVPDGLNMNEGDDFIELRHSQTPSDSELERMLKRRPLSEESCFEIESLGSHFNDTLDDVNLDQYLDELQASNIYLYSNNMYPAPKSLNSSNFNNSAECITLDTATVGYLNDRVAAIREEVQYENINLSENCLERSRSRNSNMSNTLSDSETVNTFQTVRPLSRMSNASGLSGVSSVRSKTPTSISIRSASRISLPIDGNANTSLQNLHQISHTRHASFEQPTISYYSKNTSFFENDESFQKNLNQSRNQEEQTNKVNISEMANAKASRTSDDPNSTLTRESSNKNAPSHSRDSSIEQSAPYYYSDLSSQDNLNLSASIISNLSNYNKNSFILNSKLNNQRRRGPLGKKSDISHIHNPIHSNLAYNQISDLEEGPIQIAAAARCVSVEFLSAADKCADIDHKNIYESDTLKRQKVRDSISSLNSNLSSKNIYPSLHDKTCSNDGGMRSFVQNFHEMSLSERNKSLDQILQNVVSSGHNDSSRRNSDQNQSRSSSVLTDSFSSSNITTIINRTSNDYQEFQSNQNQNKRVNNNLYVETGPSSSASQRVELDTSKDQSICDGEMMWDEDSLWRDNLRRVSHRHARSLDHLDCLASPTGASGRRSVDLKTMLTSVEGATDQDNRPRSSKITRDVTYVNDNVKSQRPMSKRRPYKKHNRNVKSSTKLTAVDANNENDVYVQLASDSNKQEVVSPDDGVYEQLATESKKAEQENESTSSNGSQFFLTEESDKSEVKKKFEIDREKLRQWDLMSSSSPGAGGGTTPASMSASITGAENHSRLLGSHGKKGIAGSNPSIPRSLGRDAPIPVRAVSPRVRSSSEQHWNGQSHHEMDWGSQNLAQSLAAEENWASTRSPSRQSLRQDGQLVSAVSPRVRRASDVDERQNTAPSQASPGVQDPLLGIQNLSAGELLGRTHEELVLLLIQLRRRHAATASAIEQCCTQIHSVQSRISTNEYPEQRQENIQRLEQLRHHLSELERHYEKSKPLVHLVDNMVKLGALYNRGGSVPTTLERLEHSQALRERLLMDQAADQRRWASSSESLSREQVQQKVEELRAMERCVAGEAGALRGLRREREALQRALGGVHLQQDLSRVHAMLAINSQKLEQTVAGNARLEQELMVLRQKLQGQQRSTDNSLSPEINGDCRTVSDPTALLEDELRRVQVQVGDLQKQRQDLSVAVRHLTNKSQSLGLVPPPAVDNRGSNKRRPQTIWLETDLDADTFVEHGSCSPSRGPLYIDTAPPEITPSPIASDELGQNGGFSNLTNVEKQEIKTVRIVKRESERRQRDRERSLQPGNSDWSAQQSANTLDQLIEEDNSSQYHTRSTSLPRGFQSSQPQTDYPYNSVYQQDNVSNSRPYMYQKENPPPSYQQHRPHVNPPNTLSLTNVNIPFDNMSISSANSSNRYLSSPSIANNNDYMGHQKNSVQSTNSRYGTYQQSNHIMSLSSSGSYNHPKHGLSQSVPYLDSPVDVSRPLTNGPMSPGMSKTGSVNSLSKGNAELSPVFTSEAARQIIIEMAGEKNGVVKSNGSQHRRQIPKEKRRHYTAPHHLSAKAIEQSAAENDIFYQEKWWRARDDVDMERVLRAAAPRGPPPLVAPPDVVRSTLPPGTPEHYSEHTIDRLLAAPNKILIPERYVPEQAPELSPEEQKKRREKVESIKKMLSSTTTPSGDPSKSPNGEDQRQREHLLQLNQILAKQVMEMSKIVAVKALQTQPTDEESSYDSEDLSPEVELPLYQQRDNFFT